MVVASGGCFVVGAVLSWLLVEFKWVVARCVFQLWLVGFACGRVAMG